MHDSGKSFVQTLEEMEKVLLTLLPKPKKAESVSP